MKVIQDFFTQNFTKVAIVSDTHGHLCPDARVVEGDGPLQLCRGAYGRFGVVYLTSF